MRELKEALLQKSYRNNLVLFFKRELHKYPGWEFTITPQLEKFLRYQESIKNDKSLVIAGRRSGKTITAAGLALWSATVLAEDLNHPYLVGILGGSKKQSDYVYEYIINFIENSEYLQEKVKGEVLRTKVEFDTGGKIVPLPAGPKSIRGLGPDMWIFDEASWIDNEILQAALPAQGASPYPRTIFLSTPDIRHLDCLFLEIWRDASRLGYKVFEWTSLDVPWTNKEKIREDRQEMSEIEWKAEYLAKPAFLLETTIPAEQLKRSIIEKASLDPELPLIAGYDPGERNQAFVITQRQNNITYVLWSKEWKNQSLKAVLDEIVDVALNRYEVDTVFADASHPGLIEKLIEAGLHVRPIHITKDKKPLLVDNLRWRFERGTVKIPRENEKLILELSYYAPGTRKDDHLVDSLALALEGEKTLRPVSSSRELPVAFQTRGTKRTHSLDSLRLGGLL